MKNIKSFTLAEVLITLVVIGIIASITVPMVMANHKKTETASKLKKFYSTLTNAVKLSEIDQGISSREWDYNNLSNVEFFEKYLAKYISYEKLGEVEYRVIEGSTYYADHAAYLNDGTIIYFDMPGLYTYDVNGEKGPNEYGRDIFGFELLGNYSDLVHYDVSNKDVVVPEMCPDKAENEDCSRSGLINWCKMGYYCTQLVQTDGWEFKDDYPKKL